MSESRFAPDRAALPVAEAKGSRGRRDCFSLGVEHRRARRHSRLSLWTKRGSRPDATLVAARATKSRQIRRRGRGARKRRNAEAQRRWTGPRMQTSGPSAAPGLGDARIWTKALVSRTDDPGQPGRMLCLLQSPATNHPERGSYRVGSCGGANVLVANQSPPPTDRRRSGC